MRDRSIHAAAWVAIGVATALPPAGGAEPARDAPAAPPAKRWSNSTELSLVVTSGNSDTQALGFYDTLTRRWKPSRFRLQLQAVLSYTADDPFAVVDTDTLCPGLDTAACLQILCGGPNPQDCVDNPPDPQTVPFLVIQPDEEPQVEKYLVEPRLDYTIHKGLFWDVGASWSRDFAAGILDRYSLFGGVGDTWWDGEKGKLDTTYGLSLVDRELEIPDPELDPQFVGMLLTWEFRDRWGKVTTFTNDGSFNVNVSDVQDFAATMTIGLAVKVNKILALKVSWQWIYNNIPTLEQIDLFFGSGQQVELGEVDTRRESLDTIFNTSLVVTF
jgi:hypothetical protein